MMMRHVLSDQLSDFALLYEEVELVSVERPDAVTAPLVSMASRWLADGGKLEAQWTHAVGRADAVEQAVSGVQDAEFRAALGGEISRAAEMLSDLLSCPSIGVRAATLRGPMCPRFHADMIPCRMLITLAGPGTEWIAHDEVDLARFADRRRSTEAAPVRPGGQVRTLREGAWSVLKGGRWDHRFGGVVHRSPHGDAGRLLISLDPIFS